MVSESNEEWCDILFIRTNIRNPHSAGWLHNHGSARFFNAVHDVQGGEPLQHPSARSKPEGALR
ncbi:hypothetical protein FGD77_06070 [Roseovarius sp. M141]|nr:hypothetical protein [Roseovarius sp. M141]